MTNRRDPSPAAYVPTGEVDQEDGIITDPARHGCEGKPGGIFSEYFCFFEKIAKNYPCENIQQTNLNQLFLAKDKTTKNNFTPPQKKIEVHLPKNNPWLRFSNVNNDKQAGKLVCFKHPKREIRA